MSYITQRAIDYGDFANTCDKTRPPRKRSDGRLKNFDSCDDFRAWHLDQRVQTYYLLDYMSKHPSQVNEELADDKDYAENLKGQINNAVDKLQRTKAKQRETEKYLREAINILESVHIVIEDAEIGRQNILKLDNDFIKELPSNQEISLRDLGKQLPKYREMDYRLRYLLSSIGNEEDQNQVQMRSSECERMQMELERLKCQVAECEMIQMERDQLLDKLREFEKVKCDLVILQRENFCLQNSQVPVNQTDSASLNDECDQLRSLLEIANGKIILLQDMLKCQENEAHQTDVSNELDDRDRDINEECNELRELLKEAQCTIVVQEGQLNKLVCSIERLNRIDDNYANEDNNLRVLLEKAEATICLQEQSMKKLVDCAERLIIDEVKEEQSMNYDIENDIENVCRYHCAMSPEEIQDLGKTTLSIEISESTIRMRDVEYENLVDELDEARSIIGQLSESLALEKDANMNLRAQLQHSTCSCQNTSQTRSVSTTDFELHRAKSAVLKLQSFLISERNKAKFEKMRYSQTIQILFKRLESFNNNSSVKPCLNHTRCPNCERNA